MDMCSCQALCPKSTPLQDYGVAFFCNSDAAFFNYVYPMSPPPSSPTFLGMHIDPTTPNRAALRAVPVSPKHCADSATRDT